MVRQLHLPFEGLQRVPGSLNMATVFQQERIFHKMNLAMGRARFFHLSLLEKSPATLNAFLDEGRHRLGSGCGRGSGGNRGHLLHYDYGVAVIDHHL